MADPLLTPDDLHNLTGYKRPGDQIRWLRDKGFRFLVGGNGRPKVLWAEVENQMLSRRRTRRPAEPRLDLTPGAGRAADSPLESQRAAPEETSRAPAASPEEG